MKDYDKAVALKPDYAEAYINRALCKLLMGRYREGWQDYEWRWDSSIFAGQRPNFPEWRGENLLGKRLLVFSEQGFGDVIQFVRFLFLLVEQGCRVTFIVDAKLSRLLSTMGNRVEFVSTLKAGPEFDFQCALMSLPCRLDIDVTSVPKSAPYLKAESDLVKHWKRRLGDHGFKVGIVWRGNPKGSVEQGRSFHPNDFKRIAQIPGVRLIGLQKSAGSDPSLDTFVEHLSELDNGPDAFIDSAAVIANLDLVISCDTSIAHLAGALNRKTWIALKYVPHWVWMLDRRDSIWYPAVRVFRQREPGRWDSVFAEIERDLRSELGNRCV